MTAHQVTARFRKPVPFDYDEEPDHIKNTEHHAFHGETMSWMSPDGDITITFTDPKGSPADFPNGSPALTAKKGQWTTPAVTLRGHPKEPKNTRYKYTVTINGVPDDPTVIFDDHGLELDEFERGVEDYARTAREAFQGLLTDLKATTGLKRDPDGVFFPGGINNIQVQVQVPLLNVNVNITVSGPAATMLGGK